MRVRNDIAAHSFWSWNFYLNL